MVHSDVSNGARPPGAIDKKDFTYKYHFMTSAPASLTVEPVHEARRAELLLDPLRQRILAEAREPTTAAEIARRVGLPAQNVNYHVRTLVEAGFLRSAGEGRKRNLVEKRYRTSAGSYLLSPGLLGEIRPAALTEADHLGAAHLLQLSARLQEELTGWFDSDADEDVRVPTLSMDVEMRFASAEQRTVFARALREAVTDVVGRFTDPACDLDGRPREGRPYRLVVGCYPVPNGAMDRNEADSGGRDPAAPGLAGSRADETEEHG